MKIIGIEWHNHIIAKLQQKHRVEQYEVEEVLETRPWFRWIEKGERLDEDVYAAYGQSEEGRYLVVFFIYKKDRQALILSARDMSARERKTYEQR